MKAPLMILSLVALAGGCAARPSVDETPAPATAFIYEPTAAAALAFDPPMATLQPAPAFERDGRATAAFAGYEDTVTTYSFTQQRDEIRVYGDYGRLERRAYTDRASVTRR